jgi:hypothetical protein
MTLPLGHGREFMRLVSSQLAPSVPHVPPTDSLTETVAAILALKLYETARRAAIAGLRRKRFAIVATSPYLNLPLRSLEQARLERHGL